MRFAFIGPCLTLLLCAPQASSEVTIAVDAAQEGHPLSRYLTGACIEDVNHEIYGGLYSQMIFGESFQEPATAGISGMWRAVQRDSASGNARLVTDTPFKGTQSQRIEFSGGEGAWGIENRGLNRWGMTFTGGAPYEGVLWARSEALVTVYAVLEDGAGAKVLAEQALEVAPGEWRRVPFALTPSGSVEGGRFAIVLKQPGAVDVGYAFLQPGEWGRYKGLPVRRDVAEALVDEGITVLRYGGSMVNHAEYRWKKMVGPRDTRPPYCGTWYPYSSNGWGILDFMDFCEAAGFEYIPAFNANETPQDMADFVQYAKGGADTEWGRKRSEEGHPEPYKMRYLEIGNEERVDVAYAAKFEAIAKAVWPLDPALVLVVGDFVYGEPVRDPFKVTGSAAHLTSLEGQQRILALAREHDREVWFDLHVGTDGPRPDATFSSMFTVLDAFEKLAEGARFKVAVFEFNSGNHTQKRGLANALAINAIERDGRIPVALSANCLQPDKQNDNAWDQGLLFLNPSKVWLQSPGWVARMIAKHYQPVSIPASVSGSGALDVSAKRSDDGKTVVLQAVNLSHEPLPVRIAAKGFPREEGAARVEVLSAPPETVNTAESPGNVAPKPSAWEYRFEQGTAEYTLAPDSFTVLVFD